MKRFAVSLFFIISAVGTAAMANDVVKVVPLQRAAAVFKCGDRCQFRGAVPSTPLRLRIFRGTIAELADLGDDPRYASGGCVELYSTIVRPRRSRGAQPLLNLNFYFRPPAWLAADGSNGRFVFVLEHDDRPNGPEIEAKPPNLRLAVAIVGLYFRSGVDVTIVPPVHARRESRRMFARSRTAPATDASTAMRLPRDQPPAMLAEAALPVRSAAGGAVSANDCAEVLFDQAPPVRFERAGAPVRIAVPEGTLASGDGRP